MTFLTLNGVTAKVMSAEMEIADLGDLSRSMAGAARREVRAQKRAWKCKLRPLNPDDGYGLIQMLQGVGTCFAYDSGINSSGGTYPTGASVYTQHSTTGADGAAVLEQDVSPAKFGTGSIAVEAAATNLLTSNQASVETDTTGFTAIDSASIARVTTHKWNLTASLQVTTVDNANATRGGVEVTAVATTTAVHTVSAYVKAATAVTVRVVGRNSTAGTDGTPTTVTLAANTWQRITAATPSITSGQTVALRILEDVAESAITYFVDGLQIETGSVMTSWVDGSRAAGLLDYSAGLVSGSKDLTVNAWVLMPLATSGCLFSIGAAGNFSYLARIDNPDGLGTNLRFVTNGPRPESADIDSTTAGGLTRGAWHMVTCVMRTNPRSGQAKKEVWINGVLAASSSPTNLPDLTTATSVVVGSRPPHGNHWTGGQIDELQVLPYAAGPAQIAGWYTATRSQATLPKLTMAGDLLRSWETATVEGVIESVESVSAYVGTTFYSGLRLITCTLEEV